MRFREACFSKLRLIDPSLSNPLIEKPSLEEMAISLLLENSARSLKRQIREVLVLSNVFR